MEVVVPLLDLGGGGSLCSQRPRNGWGWGGSVTPNLPPHVGAAYRGRLASLSLWPSKLPAHSSLLPSFIPPRFLPCPGSTPKQSHPGQRKPPFLSLGPTPPQCAAAAPHWTAASGLPSPLSCYCWPPPPSPATTVLSGLPGPPPCCRRLLLPLPCL